MGVWGEECGRLSLGGGVERLVGEQFVIMWGMFYDTIILPTLPKRELQPIPNIGIQHHIGRSDKTIHQQVIIYINNIQRVFLTLLMVHGSVLHGDRCAACCKVHTNFFP
jgi:hypothetical protein